MINFYSNMSFDEMMKEISYENYDFYIELQDHNIPEQRPVNNILVQLAKSYNLKLIATNDSHYTNKDDAYAHQVLLCKQTQSKISDEKKMSFGTTPSSSVPTTRGRSSNATAASRSTVAGSMLLKSEAVRALTPFGSFSCETCRFSPPLSAPISTSMNSASASTT